MKAAAAGAGSVEHPAAVAPVDDPAFAVPWISTGFPCALRAFFPNLRA